MKKVLLACVILGVLGGCSSDQVTNPSTTPPTSQSTSQPTDSTSSPAKGHYETISPEDAKTMMDNGPYTLVDVRTEAEYREVRIEGAILIPDTEIIARAPSELPDKDAVIIVYCRSGVRAEHAAKALADLGYTHVYTMGGIQKWPYDTVSG